MRPCPRIQVAGVHDPGEALALVRAGVDSVGLPLRLAVHAEDCGEAEAARIVAALPPDVLAVCITYATDPDEAAALCAALGVGGIQLHADLEPAALARLRALRPDLYVIKSLIVPPNPGPDGLRKLEDQAAALAPHCDALLTDTADPASGATGATGKTHDWAVSRRLAELSPRPLILAGGLHPGNVREAVLAVGPAGVDAHTGLEGPDGRKDPALVAAFVAEARAGFAALGARGRAPLPRRRD